ncbi:MAG: hypothetical protein AB1916_14490 [Thermodesulfobacteriota bacterium]
MPSAKPFASCPMCSREWKDLDAFLSDPDLRIDGYEADFERLEWSLFYFTHLRPGCGSTFTVEAEHFFCLYDGAKYTERRVFKDDCPQLCLDTTQLDRCDAFCECAFNREVIQVIKRIQGKNRSE